MEKVKETIACKIRRLNGQLSELLVLVVLIVDLVTVSYLRVRRRPIGVADSSVILGRVRKGINEKSKLPIT